MTTDPTQQARKLFHDTLVFDAPTLCHLVDKFGATQLMIGTDYPFNFHDRTPVQRIEAAGLMPQASQPAALVDALSLMVRCASGVHPPITRLRLPQRIYNDAQGHCARA